MQFDFIVYEDSNYISREEIESLGGRVYIIPHNAKLQRNAEAYDDILKAGFSIYENETIDISGFDAELKKDKMKYFIKASLTSDILLSKLGVVKNVLYNKLLKNNYTKSVKIRASYLTSLKINILIFPKKWF